MSDKSIYETLSSVDMSNHIKSVQNQRYIPWSSQWGELLKHYPNAIYEVHENEVGDPFTVSTMGIMVKVSVTINDVTRTLNYPVLNNYNKSLKVSGYEYETKKGIIKVPPASTFEINTSIMRALTKAIAMHGLSLYVYKDDLAPEMETVDSKQLQEMTNKIKEKNMKIAEVCTAWNLPSLAKLHAQNFDNFMQYLNGV